jgi:hypothetical protein
VSQDDRGRPAHPADRTAPTTITEAEFTPEGYWHAYFLGYGAALVALAERADALDTSWRPPARRSPAKVRADYLASLEPFEGGDAWRERLRQRSLRNLGFVASPDRLTPELTEAGITVSPLFACDWPTVATPGGGR